LVHILMFPFNNSLKCVLFLMLFCTKFNSFGQSTHNLKFCSWTKENGLPNNFVNAVEKDKLGFLWIAANDGLCRYNGSNSLKVFRKAENKDSITNGLQSNNIRSLFCDSKGNLWIGTLNGGLTRFNPSTNEWITFQHNPRQKNSLSNNDVLAITEDSKQRIWIGTEDGLNLLNQNASSFTHFKLNKLKNGNPSAKAILTIFEDKKGWIWVGTWAGLSKNNTAP